MWWLPLVAGLGCVAPAPSFAELAALRKPASEMRAWGRQMGWRVGCNYIPRTASNQLEMWQAATWDPATIDQELGWAADMGLNTLRVYLHDLAYQADARGMRNRMRRFLEIADQHGIKVLFVIFDDCWDGDAKVGPQSPFKPGVHNSRWLKSPNNRDVKDPSQRPRLRRYVQDLLTTFGTDSRILGWDLYNEPGNRGERDVSEALLRDVAIWARETSARQPLTVAAWGQDADLDRKMIQVSDFVTFHYYGGVDGLAPRIIELKSEGRPVIASEWLARTNQNVLEVLPVFAARGVGAINWGFVDGKTQCKYKWGSPGGEPDPNPWFHELLHADGTPYRAEEVALFRRLTAKAKAKAR